MIAIKALTILKLMHDYIIFLQLVPLDILIFKSIFDLMLLFLHIGTNFFAGKAGQFSFGATNPTTTATIGSINTTPSLSFNFGKPATTAGVATPSGTSSFGLTANKPATFATSGGGFSFGTPPTQQPNALANALSAMSGSSSFSFNTPPTASGATSSAAPTLATSTPADGLNFGVPQTSTSVPANTTFNPTNPTTPAFNFNTNNTSASTTTALSGLLGAKLNTMPAQPSAGLNLGMTSTADSSGFKMAMPAAAPGIAFVYIYCMTMKKSFSHYI